MSTFLSKVHSLLRTPRPGAPALDAELLEDRIMLSAVPMVDAAIPMEGDISNAFPLSPLEQPVTSVVLPVDQVSSGSNVSQPTSIDEWLAPRSRTLELVFINSNTANYQQLVDDLLTSADANRDFEVYVLDASKDGIQQISEILAGYSDVDAIHLVSHSESGSIQLGDSWLGNANLAGYAGQLASWQSSLSSSADILVYGCDLADSVAGRDLVESISALTGADVAASVDDTGHSQWGGNWVLEYHVGAIESGIAFSTDIQQNWLGKLATITVTTFTDVINSGDGVLSLREAIIQANSGTGGDTIVLSAGTYTLSIAGQNENLSATGDLDINKSVTIVGAGMGTTRINGNGLDRVIDIQSGTVAVSGITIQGGLLAANDWGAGFLIGNTGTLNLSQVEVTNNATGSGAGIYVYGTLTAVDTAITNNTASSWGGGLYNDRGNISLNRVTISGNLAGADGGGINNAGSGAVLSLVNTTISGNTASNNGGGLWTSRNVSATNVTIAFNSAAAGDGIYAQGGTSVVSLKNTLLYNPLGTNANRAMVSLGYNLDSDGSAGLADATDINNVNPLLGSLQNNGGFTSTHATRVGSAAINSGTAVGSPAMDQRSVNRIGTADIGAFEYVPALTRTGELLVNQTTASSQATSAQTRGSQHAVSLAADGSYAVVWSSQNQDGSGWGVYTRRFNAVGVAITNEILVNQTTSLDQKWARVASADNGNFVVTWSHDAGGSPQDVYFRMFAANGTALGAEQRANNTTTNLQTNSVIAMDQSTGQFVIAWQGEGPGDTSSIFFRRFAANGTALDATDQLATSAGAHTEQDAAIAMQTGGAFVIAWEAGDNNHIYFQRFDGTGAKVGSETQIDNLLSTSFGIDVASDDAGNFTFAYREQSIVTGVWTRGYNADGTQRYGWSYRSGGDTDSPSIAMLGDGSHIITWQMTGDGSGIGVYAQRFNADGSTNGASFLVNTTTTGTQSQSSVTAVDIDNFVIAWSGQGTGDTDGVFVRQFNLGNLAPVITSNGGLATAAISVSGNTTAVTTVTATDADLPAQTLIYSLNGGVDSAKFAINSSTGVLSFISAPNFSTPTDVGANNVYDVIVRVSDGTLTDTQAIAVTVAAPVNASPVITSNGGAATTTIAVAENSTAVTAVTATDTSLPAQTLTYSISGGVDSAKFTMNSSTGALSFIAAPNFEAPTDIGANNVYEVIVQVSDGALADTQAIAVTVSNVNEAPVGIADSYTLQEDGSLTTVANWFNNAWSTRKSISFNNATGPNLIDQVVLVTLNASNIDYSLTQNAGQDLRFVDTDGILLNYEIETWNEAGTSTVWVRVPQINAASTTDSISMYYGNAAVASGQNPTGVWTSSAQAILHMNGTVVDSSIQANTVVNSGTASATGIISGARSFDGLSSEINLGSAAAVDNIFDGGGTIAAWINPTGWGENNVGRIADKASIIFSGVAVGTGWSLQLDGPNQGLIFEQGFSTTTGRWRTATNSISLNTWQQITVIYDSTSAVNNPRVFINGVEVAVTESSTPVGTAGSDAAANLKVGNFSQSTDLTFAGAIDEFQLYNATLTANQILANYQSMSRSLASIGSAQSGPGGVLTNDSDVEGASLSVTLGTGPSHQQSFTLNANGSFTYTPVANYNGGDSFTYSVSDGANSSGPITVSLTITAVNDIPIITSGGAASGVTFSLAENTTVVTTFTATDPDLPSQTLLYSLSGGTDQGRFAIGASTGALTFLVGPNFEAPSDSDVNNNYQVIVTVSDGQGGIDTQTILVSILDANEFATSAVSDTNTASNSVNENSATGTLVGITALATDSDATNNVITYSLSNNAGGRFVIGTTTGVVTVNNGSLLNREAAASHTIVVRASSSDGSFRNQNFTIAVGDVDEFDVGAIIDSNPTANRVLENAVNGTLVGITAVASDADATNSTITYSLGDSAGGRFAIDSSSGVVSVADGTLLDFEANGSHQILVQATSSDGSTNTTRLTIVVNDINESLPVFVSSDRPSIVENQSIVQRLLATDSDLPAQTLSYSILGGVDAARFAINSANELVFVSAPDFENPVDSNTDNIYNLVVAVDDGNGGTAVQAIQVQVTNVNEIPLVADQRIVILQGESYQSIGQGVLTGASDIDGDALAASVFASPSHGTLVLNPDGSFQYTPDAGFSGADLFTFQVSDGHGGFNQGSVSFLVSPNIPFIPTQPDIISPPSEERQAIKESGASTKSASESTPSKSADAADSAQSETTPTTQPSITLTNVGDSSQSTSTSNTSDRAGIPVSSANYAEGSRSANHIVRVATFSSSSDSNSIRQLIRGLHLQTNIKVGNLEQLDPASLGTTEYSVISSVIWDDLDRLREQFRNESSEQQLMLGTTAGVASSLSVGYVMWLLRGGYVVAGFMAQLPAWRLIDPLPVLAQLEALGDDEDDDSLQSMVDRSNTHHDKESDLASEDQLDQVVSEPDELEPTGSRIT